MKIKKLYQDFSVCRVKDYSLVNLDSEFCFIGKTDNEQSLVCVTSEVPSNTIKRDAGWKAFCVQGILDFSLIGVLAKISAVLAEHDIPIFAVSTYNTDYVLVKEENYQKGLKEGLKALESAGYKIAD